MEAKNFKVPKLQTPRRDPPAQWAEAARSETLGSRAMSLGARKPWDLWRFRLCGLSAGRWTYTSVLDLQAISKISSLNPDLKLECSTDALLTSKRFKFRCSEKDATPTGPNRKKPGPLKPMHAKTPTKPWSWCLQKKVEEEWPFPGPVRWWLRSCRASMELLAVCFRGFRHCSSASGNSSSVFL